MKIFKYLFVLSLILIVSCGGEEEDDDWGNGDGDGGSGDISGSGDTNIKGGWVKAIDLEAKTMKSIKVGSNGIIYVMGYSDLKAFSSEGEELWNKPSEQRSDNYAFMTLNQKDNAVIVSQSNYNISKFDSEGHTMWTTSTDKIQESVPNFRSGFMTSDINGNIYIVNQASDSSKGNHFIAKLSSENGELITIDDVVEMLDSQYGNIIGAQFLDLVTDSQNMLYVVGRINLDDESHYPLFTKITKDGDFLWNNKYEESQKNERVQKILYSEKDDVLYVVRYKSSAYTLQKYSTSGNEIWKTDTGGIGTFDVIAVDSYDNILKCIPGKVIKYSSQGKETGRALYDNVSFKDISCDKSGNCYAIGVKGDKSLLIKIPTAGIVPEN